MPYALCITHYVAPSPDVENFSSINLDRRTFSQGTNIFIPSCVPPYIASTPTSTGAAKTSTGGPDTRPQSLKRATRRRRGASGERTRSRSARTQGHEVSREQDHARPSLSNKRPRQHITSMLVPHEVEIPQFSQNMHSENIKPAE